MEVLLKRNALWYMAAMGHVSNLVPRVCLFAGYAVACLWGNRIFFIQNEINGACAFIALVYSAY
jgi:hypothetical protein